MQKHLWQKLIEKVKTLIKSSKDFIDEYKELIQEEYIRRVEKLNATK